MNYYEHHLGDYVKDAGHLTMVEDGAYRRLIDAYYIKEAPIPLDLNKACRLARAMDPDERAAVETVLNEFFEKTVDGWMHSRCDQEIARYREKQAAEQPKKENDRQRQQRARDRRKQMYEFLRDHGVTAPWDATTEQLQRAIDDVNKAGKSGDVTPPAAPPSEPDHAPNHAPVTPPVTAPVTRDNTATQSPVPSHHSSGADAPARPAAEPAAAPLAPAPAPKPELPARLLPCDDLIPRDDDRYGIPGKQTVDQLERELWDAGKALLMNAGVAKSHAGSFIGGLLAKHSDRAMVMEVVRAAVVKRPAEPKGWMTKACAQRAAGQVRPVSNLAERRVATMQGLTNTGEDDARDDRVIDAQARFVG